MFLIGYSLLGDGKLITRYSSKSSNKIKDIAIKNNIINTLLNVLNNYKNAVNLTSIVSTEGLQSLANKSEQESIPKDSACPTDIFKQVEENAVGKDSIGISAVGGKGFSAICYYVNDNIEVLKTSILSGNFDYAEFMLNKIVKFLKVDQGIMMKLMPNTNWSWIDRILTSIQIPENIRSKLDYINSIYNNLPDVYSVVGELLNASADNAKLLILKKINAHKEWADFYIAGVMSGYTLDQIYDIMCDKDVNNIVLSTDKNVFSGFRDNYANSMINGILNDNNRNAFKKIYKVSSELQFIGALAGINQGYPTSKYEIIKFIKRIERSGKELNSKFNVSSFFLDEEFAKSIIDAYEQNKESINPFDIIINHPLYKSQWEAFLVSVSILNSVSVRNKLEFYFLKNSKFKTKGDYNNMVAKIGKQLDLLWMKEYGLKFTIPEEFTKLILPSNMKVQGDYVWELNDSNAKETPAVFKRYMEYYVIPKLKQIQSDNKFISTLVYDIKNKYDFFGDRFILDAKEIYFKTPINMMNIDEDPAVKEMYIDLYRDFKSLNNIKFDGENNILDLFYFYNIVANNIFSRDSMLRFYSDVATLSNNDDNIVIDHNNWLSTKNFDELVGRIRMGSDVKKSEVFDLDNYKLKQNKYYDVSKSNLEKIEALPGFLDHYENIIIYSSSEAVETLKKYGMSESNAEETANTARAFVFNGLIFINKDLADRSDLRHELSHIILGTIKASNDKNIRSKILSFYEKHKYELDQIIDTISRMHIYSGLKDTDLIEEAIAYYIEKSDNNLREFVKLAGDDYNSIEDVLDSFITEENVNTLKMIQKVSNKRDEMISLGYKKKESGSKQKLSILENCE